MMEPIVSPSAWADRAIGGIDDSVERLLSAANAGKADLLLVVPPFASPDWPSLGVHIIAGIAVREGLEVAVLYANLGFARVIGPRLYRRLCTTPTEQLMGERIFRKAYASLEAADPAPPRWDEVEDAPDFGALQDVAAAWTEALGAAVAPLPFRHLGLSSVFEQTLSSLSLIHAVKARSPEKVALMGGANTDGTMAGALAEFDPIVDHYFQGESEASFAEFVRGLKAGKASKRVLTGEVNTALDEIPAPDYAAFFSQFRSTVHESVCADGLSTDFLRLPYESSRGCWWGAKHHCTFCGLNANGMNHRIKSADKVHREITELAERHAVREILMVDNIMPHSYFSTLLPELAKAEEKLSIFYEQKANLSLERMAALSDAGVRSIQPGIESLSTSLLKRMRKGSSAQVNLDCLRHAKSLGVDVVWNLLTDFPGDKPEDYEGMLALIPKLHHLQPPTGVGGLSLDRFSPYHSDPKPFGISKVWPIPVYAKIFPGADLDKISYHFGGDYQSALRDAPRLHQDLTAAVEDWIMHWEKETQPLLFIFDLGPGRHLVVDTRACAVEETRLVDDAEAEILLRGTNTLDPAVRRALDLHQMSEVDGRYGAIACADAASPAWTGRQRPGLMIA